MKPVRLPYRVKLDKIIIIISGIASVSLILAGLGYVRYREPVSSAEDLKQIKVLVLYSAGTPATGWQVAIPLPSQKVDATTSATSKLANTAVVAEMIADALRAETAQVTLKEVEGIQKADEILFADAILIGSATRFGLMSWQVKRFFDEILFSICIHRKAKLSDKYVGGFTTCEVTASGKDCIKSINRALYDFRVRKLPGLIILDKTPHNEMERKTSRFVNKLITKLK